MKFRAFLLGALLLAGGVVEASACEDLHNAPNSRWTTTRQNRISWLVTPCGDLFFSRGVNVIDGGVSGRPLTQAHYDWTAFQPTLPAWIAQTKTRLDVWGFNTAGAWSLPPRDLGLPGVINLELGRLSRFHWFDPFDPTMEATMKAEARKLTAPYRGSPYRMGYFSDNEVGWWSGALFAFYSAKPASNFTKQRWVETMRRHYHQDWSAFTAEFVPPEGVTSWETLLHAEHATKLRPGTQGIQAVRRWTAVITEHYYALSARAIHDADPEALFFGDRLPIYYDPIAIKAAARHVDAIATNYNVDSPDGWIARYFFDGLRDLSGAKPVLISEWFYAAEENRSGNRNNGHLMTVKTQAERARGAARAIENFAAVPEIVGLHWFQYYDHPRGGRADGEDYNFGLVDTQNRPYEELIAAIAPVNRRMPELHAAATSASPNAARPFRIPRAVIDPSHESLIDWPKPASLLPPMTANEGEVAFGEAYLSWSERGLALASIGQDYYDLDLLAYEGPFPLSEAYRVELGVDAGAGPKRFTLYFIPPHTKQKDHPPMAPMLCLGAPAEHGPTSCSPVPGAQALYFGADQPRITAEAIFPWSALGVAGPPPSGRIKVEVSGTAFHRSRWMSLSGRPPSEDVMQPEHWPEMRLVGSQPTL